MKPRYIDANELMQFCQNTVGKTIDCNDIARFPSAVISWDAVGERLQQENMVGVNIDEYKALYAFRNGHTQTVASWERVNGDLLCSKCGSGVKSQPLLFGKPLFLFCPLCGAKMEGDEHA